MSKEGLLISPLKSDQSITELCKSKDNNAETKEIKEKFNVLRNRFSKEGIKKIRKTFRFREETDKYLEGLEKKNSSTEQEKQEKKHYTKKLKKAEKFLKKLKEEDINRLEKHCYCDNDDLYYKGIRQIEIFFNKFDENYYKPTKTKDAFNNSYIEYESRGDRDKMLSVKEYPEKNCIMNSKSDNIEIIMSIETDNIIKELFQSFLKRYQKNLEEKMKDSNFVFEGFNLLYYSLHKTTLKRGGLYIKSPKWLMNKRATINPKRADNNCFRDVIVSSLNYEDIPNHPERISNLMSFFDQYNWKG